MASRFIPTCWICDKAITLEHCNIDEYGKGVHAECYVAKLTHQNANPVREKEERSWQLCAIANKEQDSRKLLAYMREIDQLLEEIERLKRLDKSPTDS